VVTDVTKKTGRVGDPSRKIAALDRVRAAVTRSKNADDQGLDRDHVNDERNGHAPVTVVVTETEVEIRIAMIVSDVTETVIASVTVTGTVNEIKSERRRRNVGKKRKMRRCEPTMRSGRRRDCPP